MEGFVLLSAALMIPVHSHIHSAILQIVQYFVTSFTGDHFKGQYIYEILQFY
jgi:hypothetical protein